ncbi:MAG TPA: hypothetical protein VFA46_19665, partial [Actinomycetes bacterium]|nr:hypothetical protein [Actinomycetes bacterium]
TDAVTTDAVTTDAVTTDAVTTDAVTTDAVTTDAVTTDAVTTDAAPITEPSAAAVAAALLACAPPTSLAALMVDLAVMAPVVPEGVGPVTVVQRFNSLLRDGFVAARAVPWSAPGSAIRRGLAAVFEHVRNLASQTGSDSENPGGAPVPTRTPAPGPVPLPSPLPTVPTEQGGGGGSSVTSGSHGHGKGGSAYAVLGGDMLILFLRPLGVSRRLRSSGCSLSLQPLVLPG